MLFQDQVQALVRAGVSFVVVGGVAANLQGFTRATYDLDICFEPSLDNRRRLAALLREWKAYPRGVDAGLPFVLDAKALATSHVLTLTTSWGDIDVMDEVKGVGSFEQVLAESEEVVVGHVRFRSLGLPGLLEAKRAAGRPKDRDQIPELEALLELRRRR